jgi:hypothetical protein
MPVPDEEWLYHLTRRSVAARIQKDGMKSQFTLTGLRNAHPEGAFATEKKAKQRSRKETELKGYLRTLTTDGHTLETIRNTDLSYVRFNVMLVINNEKDRNNIERQAKLKFDEFCRRLEKFTQQPDLPVLPPKSGPGNLSKIRSGPVVKQRTGIRSDNHQVLLQAAAEMFDRQPNHFLTELARQKVDYYYDSEEQITASHIYFLDPKFAEQGYKDYSKTLNSNDLVVLRVRKADVPDAVQDQSEGKAVMAIGPVRPHLIDIMLRHNGFIEPGYRCNTANWMDIIEWNAPAGGLFSDWSTANRHAIFRLLAQTYGIGIPYTIRGKMADDIIRARRQYKEGFTTAKIAEVMSNLKTMYGLRIDLSELPGIDPSVLPASSQQPAVNLGVGIPDQGVPVVPHAFDPNVPPAHIIPDALPAHGPSLADELMATGQWSPDTGFK